MSELFRISIAETQLRSRGGAWHLAVVLFCATVVALALAAPADAERTYQCQITAKVAPSATECNVTGNTVPGGGFSLPFGVAIDSSNNLWVTDTGKKIVNKFDSAGNFLAQGTGPGAFSGSQYIEGIAWDNIAGKAFVSDSNGDDLWGLNPDASYSATNFDSGLGSACCYLRVAADNSGGAANGDLYVSGVSGSVVRLDSSGTAHNFSASAPYISGNKITGTPSGSLGTFNDVSGSIAVDGNGDIYVAASGKVNRFDSSGTFVKAYDGTGAPGPLGPLPGVAVDPTSGNLLVIALGNVIYEFESSGAFLGELTGTTSGTPFGALRGIAVDASGHVYVADTGKGAVDLFTPGAVVPAVTFLPVTNPSHTSGTLNATVDPNSGGPITQCKFEYGTDNTYSSGSVPCSPDPSSSPPGSNFSVPTDVSADISGLTTETTYHYRIVASNANGSKNSIDQTFTPHAVTGLTTDAATQVGATSAVLNGSFVGSGDETHYYYQWGTSTSYGNLTASPPGDSAGSPSGPGRTSVPVELLGLDPETNYHYRIVASTSFGTSIGGDQQFTTPQAVAELKTGGASDIAAGRATLSGSFSGDGTDTAYYFEYGKTTAYGQTTSTPPGADAGSGIGTQDVSALAEEVLPDTTYHYRIVATNSFGSTYGLDRAFISAPPILPTVTGSSVGAVTRNSATLTAEIKPGFGPTIYRFEYGKTDSYGSRTYPSESIGFNNVDHLISATIGALAPGTIYHFRVVATNFAGSSAGGDQIFQTPDLPTVVDNDATRITQTTASLGANIRPGFSPATVHFEYGLTSLYGNSTPESAPVGADDSAHGVNETVAGLQPSTAYHYRVVVTNAVGTVSGPDSVFTTAPPAATGPTPIRCRKGFIKKQGKCVRKHRKHRRDHHKRGGRRG